MVSLCKRYINNGLNQILVQSIFCFLILLLSHQANAQMADPLIREPGKEQTRHQLGLNASRFILFFDEQSNNLDLGYRLCMDSLNRIRLASTLELSTASDAVSSWAVRLGVDRTFATKKNWAYYYGVDAQYFSTISSSSGRRNENYGAQVFIGILFHIGNYFSLSTEPTLAFLRYSTMDDNDFNPNSNRKWFETKFLNIGQVNFNFHF